MPDQGPSPPRLVRLSQGSGADWVERLTPAERLHLAGYSATKRQEDWLLGRAAAKQAVREALASAGKPCPGWTEFEIRSSPSGAPRVHGLAPGVGSWAVTLTHGHGRAAAWALPAGGDGGLPGVDLERIRARRVGSLRFYLHEEERDWVKKLPLAESTHDPDSSKREPGPRDVAAIVLWALKEAAFKAIQPPRGTGLLDVEVSLESTHDAALGRARVGYRGAAKARAADLNVSRISAGWEREGDLVLAWVEARGGFLPDAD